MTQKELQERNKQIALMLGMDNDAYIIEKNIEANTGYCHLRFHSDWHDLMRIVSFIKNLEKDYPKLTDEVCSMLITYDKETVFIAVSNFAELYNNIKNE